MAVPGAPVPPAARLVQDGSTVHPSRVPRSSSTSVSRASPTTACAACLTASNRAALTVTIRTPGAKAVQEEVVKSCSRVPTASTTSAAAAMLFADVAPMIPSGSAVEVVLVRDQGPARDGLDDRDAVGLGDGEGLAGRPRSTARLRRRRGEDARLARRSSAASASAVASGRCRGHPVQPLLEHGGREVVPLRLDVLRQRQHDRAGVGGVGQDPCDLGQRGQQLFGTRDPVEVSRDRPERIVDRDGRVSVVLDLLQHRVRSPAIERVSRKQQHRQPVGVGDAGSGDHVQRARPHRCGRRHDLPPVGRPCVARPRRAPSPARSGLARWAARRHLVQRGPETEHVAMPEDPEDPGEERHLRAVEQLRALRDHPSHQRLRGRQPDRRGGHQTCLLSCSGHGVDPSGGAGDRTAGIGAPRRPSCHAPSCAPGRRRRPSSRSSLGPAITFR